MAPKLLFVNHSLKLGGARRSLRELIRARGAPCDLVVQMDEREMDDDAIRAFFGPLVERIERFWLPFELCYRGRPALVPHAYRWAGLAALWWINREKFYRFARGYDAVHLNSVVLHPMVRADLPFVLHVREIVDLDLRRVRRHAERARGVIFIDEATRAPFTSAHLRAATVLNNPVDMTGVGPLPTDAAARIGGAPEHLTIFCIAGLLIPEKGVDRVIRAFRETRDPNTRLLIVGEGEQEGVLRGLAARDPRIIFWGVERNIETVYALADYVLRGEAYPCVGRTIYEALYAGCGVIIPGSPSENTLFEYARFRDRVSFYPPADEARLRVVFETLAGHKLPPKQGASNAGAHAAAFEDFIQQII